MNILTGLPKNLIQEKAALISLVYMILPDSCYQRIEVIKRFCKDRFYYLDVETWGAITQDIHKNKVN